MSPIQVAHTNKEYSLSLAFWLVTDDHFNQTPGKYDIII